jgi:hypothetical protein
MHACNGVSESFLPRGLKDGKKFWKRGERFPVFHCSSDNASDTENVGVAWARPGPLAWGRRMTGVNETVGAGVRCTRRSTYAAYVRRRVGIDTS